MSLSDHLLGPGAEAIGKKIAAELARELGGNPATNEKAGSPADASLTNSYQQRENALIQEIHKMALKADSLRAWENRLNENKREATKEKVTWGVGGALVGVAGTLILIHLYGRKK